MRVTTLVAAALMLLLTACGGGSSGSTSQSVTVTVSPASATVPLNVSKQFTANVGGGDISVKWSVNGVAGGNSQVGTIDSFGDYEATSIPSPATVTVTATSVADSSKSASANVTVVYNSGTTAAQNAPVKMGTSGSNVNDKATTATKVTCCGGTLGALVQRAGTFYVLSANHVLARSNAGAVGDPISQPGADANNCTAGQTIATLSQWADLQNSNVDAAIAAIVAGKVDTSGSILDLGAAGANSIAAAPPSATLAIPSVVMAANEGVAKVGSTTGQTCSTVSSVNTSVKVDYSQTCGGSTSFSATFTNQVIIQGGSFSASGDSGSLVVTTDTARPVGLLFAGNTTSSTANPIQDVLTALQDPQTHVAPAIVGGGDHAVNCVANAASSSATSASAQSAVITAQERQRVEDIRQRHLDELSNDPAVSTVEIGVSNDQPGAAALEIHLARPRQQAIPAQVEGVRTRVVRDFTLSPAEQRNETAEFTRRMSDANAAKENHAEEMLQSRGIYAVGVGRSADDPTQPAIVIYGERSAIANVPAVIDGVRTRVIEGDRYTTTWGKHTQSVSACRVPQKNSPH